MYSPGGLAVLFIGLEVQLDVNAPDDENVPFHLDLANSFGVQPVVRRRDLTRLQRASECARESAGRCGDDVVQSRGMCLEGPWWQFVMIGNWAVRPEYHWLGFDWQVRPANRSFDAFDAYFGSVYNVSHVEPPDHRSYPMMLWWATELHDRAYGRLYRS